MPDTISPQLVRLFPRWHPTLLWGWGWGCYNLLRVLPCLTGKFRRQIPFATPSPLALLAVPFQLAKLCVRMAKREVRSHSEGRFTCWTRQALIKSAQKVHGKRNCLTINVYHVEISRFLFNVAKCLPPHFPLPVTSVCWRRLKTCLNKY